MAATSGSTSTTDSPSRRIVVGRIGRAHGIRGDVAVEVRSDSPEERFVPDATLEIESGRAVTVADVRWHGARLLVRFSGVHDRTAADGLAGELLYVTVPADERTGDPDEFFDHQLAGLRVTDVDGTFLGEVRDVLHFPGQEVLAVVVAEEGRELGPDSAAGGDGGSAGTMPDDADPGDRDECGPGLGREVLVPFVRSVVPVVDLSNGLVIVDPPEGLF